jgi:hypothetical protein
MSSSAAFEIDFPDVGFRAVDQDYYKYLVTKDAATPFSGLTMADVFIYAMALGFKNGKKILYQEKERVPNMPANAFNSEMRWLMRSIAITEHEGLEPIIEHKKVIEVAEAYANKGIQIIKQFMEKQTLDLEQDAVFESDLRKQIEKI